MSKIKGYNDFTSINEFWDYYHLDHLTPIFEDAKEDDKKTNAKETIKPMNGFDVVYAN